MLAAPMGNTDCRISRPGSEHALAIGVALIVGAVLAGCGKSNDSPTPSPSSAPTVLTKAAAVASEVTATPPAPESSSAMAASATPSPKPAVAQAAAASGQADPPDVVAFREKRDQCDELRGEDPTDRKSAKEKAELRANTIKYCAGSDTALKLIRNKYAGNKKIVESD